MGKKQKPRDAKARSRKVKILFNRFGRDRALDMLNGQVYREKERAYREQPNGRAGHVYIASIGDGLFKIGKTVNLVERQVALSASNSKFKIIFNRYVKDMHFVEQATHQEFGKCHVDREIFRLPEIELDRAKRFIENHGNL